jgi:hypothetical protein
VDGRWVVDRPAKGLVIEIVGGVGRGGTVIMMDSGCFFWGGGVHSYQNLICLKISEIHAIV